MIQLFRMAFRDLGRNRRRSFFSALALAIGMGLLLLIAAVVEGEIRGSIETAIRLDSGHLQVRAATYDQNKTSLAFEDLVENPEQVAQQIAALPPVKVATPRLFASGIITSGNQSEGVRVQGIDPSSPANAPFRDGLVSGSFVTAGDRNGIVIGQTLANNLELKTGDSLNLLVNTSNGDVDTQAFTVRGIYNTHTPSIDQVMVFLPLEKAQAITRAVGHASAIFILLDDRTNSSAVVSALQSSKYKALTFEDLNSLLVELEQLASGYMVLIYLVILGITATVIINTLLMAVFERTREIGILGALGMKSWRIMAMFFAESSLLAVGGILMGLVLGITLILLLSQTGIDISKMGISGITFGEKIYPYLTLKDTVSLSIEALIVTLLAALYPALLAARMEPVEAIKREK